MKKIFVILLTVLIAFSCCACSTTKSNYTNTATESTAATTESTTISESMTTLAYPDGTIPLTPKKAQYVNELKAQATDITFVVDDNFELSSGIANDLGRCFVFAASSDTAKKMIYHKEYDGTCRLGVKGGQISKIIYLNRDTPVVYSGDIDLNDYPHNVIEEKSVTTSKVDIPEKVKKTYVESFFVIVEGDDGKLYSAYMFRGGA